MRSEKETIFLNSVGSNIVREFEVQDFWRVRSSILVDKPGFGRVRSSVFPDLSLGLVHFWLNRFEVRAFWMGMKGFEIRFWWTNLGSSEFEFDLSSLKHFKVCYIWVWNKVSGNVPLQ